MIQPQPQHAVPAPEPVPYTTQLPPLGTGVNNRRPLAEVLRYTGGSAAGLSATNAFIGCPRYSELRAMGVEPKPTAAELEGPVDLEAAAFGTMMHALRCERFLYGSQYMYWLLSQWQNDLTAYDYYKALELWQTYDIMFPLGTDPFRVLGVELEVRTPLQLWDGGWVVKTVKYDTVIQYPDGTVYSFECKTTSKGGESVLRPYLVQGMTHSGLWNANPWLVAQYGKMHGSLFDLMVKTKVPDCDRRFAYFSDYQQQRALLYMCAPQQSVSFRRSPVDGKMPEMFGHCFGHWRPCEMIGICHEQAYGMYQYRDGRDYDGR